MDRFTGTTVLVTGAGSGLGRAIARAFAAEGASVVAAGRTAATLHETVGLIEAAGGTALAVTADVTDSGQLRDLVRETVTRYGGLDVAVNNAGIFRGSGPVGEVGEEDWDAVMRTNLTGVWLAMKHEIAHMKENGGGVIVNISSNLGAHLRIPGAAAYLTSKAGVSVLTRAAALDHIHQGIRINAVSPGASAAPMSLRPGETEADRTERMKAENPSAGSRRPRRWPQRCSTSPHPRPVRWSAPTWSSTAGPRPDGSGHPRASRCGGAPGRYLDPACCRRGVACGESGERAGQLGWPDDLDVGVEVADRGGEAGPRPGAEGEAAAVGAEFLDDSVPREGGHRLGRETEDDFTPAGPVGGGAVGPPEPAGDERGHVLAGQLAWGEARAGGGAGAYAVGAEGTPVVPVEIPGDQVPATAPGDEVVRLHPAWPPDGTGSPGNTGSPDGTGSPGNPGSIVPVVEAQFLAGVDDAAQLREDLRADRGGTAGPARPDRGDPQRVDAPAQARWHDLAHGDQGPGRVLPDRFVGRRRPESQRQGDRLAVVEQQRGQVRTGVQTVATGGSLGSADRVAQLP